MYHGNYSNNSQSGSLLTGNGLDLLNFWSVRYFLDCGVSNSLKYFIPVPYGFNQKLKDLELKCYSVWRLLSYLSCMIILITVDLKMSNYVQFVKDIDLKIFKLK